MSLCCVPPAPNQLWHPLNWVHRLLTKPKIFCNGLPQIFFKYGFQSIVACSRPMNKLKWDKFPKIFNNYWKAWFDSYLLLHFCWFMLVCIHHRWFILVDTGVARVQRRKTNWLPRASVKWMKLVGFLMKRRFPITFLRCGGLAEQKPHCKWSWQREGNHHKQLPSTTTSLNQ